MTIDELQERFNELRKKKWRTVYAKTPAEITGFYQCQQGDSLFFVSSERIFPLLASPILAFVSSDVMRPLLLSDIFFLVSSDAAATGRWHRPDSLEKMSAYQSNRTPEHGILCKRQWLLGILVCQAYWRSLPNDADSLCSSTASMHTAL